MKRSADFVGLLGRLDRSHGPVPGRERRRWVRVPDNARTHTSRTSREALALRPWLTVEWLPRYAPDLNGVITQDVQNRPIADRVPNSVRKVGVGPYGRPSGSG